MALQSKKTNHEQKQSTPTATYGNYEPILSPLGNVLTPNGAPPSPPRPLRRPTLSRPIGLLSTPSANTSNTSIYRTPLRNLRSNNQRIRPVTSRPQRLPYQKTFTSLYYEKKDVIKLIPLSYKRGTVLLSQPLKRKKERNDARDRGLAKLRNENQTLQQKFEELQAVNRRLQMDKERILSQNKKFQSETDTLQQYKHSLNNILSQKTQKEQIFWSKNEPIFVLNKNKNQNKITGMNMNLEVIEFEYKKNDLSNCIEGKFENYFEKIVRSARIFQDQYFKTLTKKTVMDQKQVETEKLQTKQEKLRAAKTREIEALKVRLENTLKNFKNEKKIIVQQQNEILSKEKEKMNDFRLKLQTNNGQKQELITKLEESQIKKQQIIVEKQRLEIEYGAIKKKLRAIETHPIISNVKHVNEILVLRHIQRRFYDEIFDEKANIHHLAFEYLRKEIKNKTQFTTRYCKQMALKILFEMIHICYTKINEKFMTIYNEICVQLGIDNIGDGGNRGLEKALDFLLTYQFEEIFDNLYVRMIDDLIEEIYESEFVLIASHSAQNIFSYNLHETNNPMMRDKHLCQYIHRICVICFEMIIFSHRKAAKERLIFYPSSFMVTANELLFDADIYDKCTAHCEKKCDKILFYVFPIVMYAKDINNIFAALAVDDDVKHDIDDDLDESESKTDELLDQETKIKIRVVTRKNITRSLSKDTAPCLGSESNKDPLEIIGAIKLFKKAPNIAVIMKAFKSIHAQQHKNLFEAVQEYLEPEDESDDNDSDGEDAEDLDGDMLDMKIYKILFNILVSCYVKIMDIIQVIGDNNLNVKQLEFDKRYHLLLNLEHYYNKFNEMDIENRNEESDIVMNLIDAIYGKYCKKYSFLNIKEKKINEKTKIYIMKCCECCFHFGSSSICTIKEEVKEEEDEVASDEYGLFPLCFVRDSEQCSNDILSTLKEDNLNNDIIDFKEVSMGNDDGLCVYNDIIHEKESNSDIECVINAKICYFTWPAIVTTTKNNQFIYGNIPRKYLTKIWVLLNNELYDEIYGNINE